jgi:hypothetical protein
MNIETNKNKDHCFLISLKICRIYFGSLEIKTSSKMRVVRVQSANPWIDRAFVGFFKILRRIAEMWCFIFRKKGMKNVVREFLQSSHYVV